MLPLIFFYSLSTSADNQLSVKSQTTSQKIWKNKLFPRPKAIEKDVHFWKHIYTKVPTSEGLIHDNADLSIVYENIRLPAKLSYKARSRYTKKIKKKYKNILIKLAGEIKLRPGSHDKHSNLSHEEKRVLALWPDSVTSKELMKASKQVRFQLGQSNRFKDGLVRSGRWRPYILKILKDMGLPKEIAALPHVESSFNYKAYSKVGAAGMWQFTRSTGRRYMRIDHVIDERLDPFIATISAARLLKNNYALTGTWPLAMTAYNHGSSGMRRAAKKMGTTDITTILRKYKSRSFGFASRNFYPSFLAAVQISEHPEKYFKNLKLAPPADVEFVKLQDYIGTDTLINVVKLSRSQLMDVNPALRSSVWNGNKYIPKTYEFRIDRSIIKNLPKMMEDIAGIDQSQRFKNQKRDRYHRVTKGQTLSIIAARYGLKMKDLIASNNMRNKHMIRIGQVLILPYKDSQKKQVAYNAKPKKTKVKEKNSPEIQPVAVSKDGLYVVKKGDNLNLISRKNAMTIRQLLKLNHLKNKHKIFPGQKLTIIKPEEIKEQNRVQLAQIDKTQSTMMPEAFDSGDKQTINGVNNASIDQTENKTDPVEVINQPIVETAESDEEEGSGLLADPSDYSVNGKNSIVIQAAETLGHYAEWLQIKSRDLRRLNKMKYRKPVVVGKRLKLSFNKVTPKEFEEQRLLYHKNLQGEFFERNQIVEIDNYRLNHGDSIWKLTQNTYKIPFWLLRQYNPDLDMNRISSDKIIRFPKVKQRIRANSTES